jgi:ketosteroid isomerase-like protein
MERSIELADLVRRIYAAVSAGDDTALLAALSAHDGLVFVGTDPDEWFDTPDAVRAMLRAQAGAGVTVEGGEIVAYEEGTVGWTADRGHFVLPDATRVPFRMTAVFHRENGRWALVQEHASVAIANEDTLGTSLA